MNTSEKLRALAVMAELSPDNLEGLRDRVHFLLLQLDLEIERKRPGYMMGRVVGNDCAVNVEEAS